MSELKRSYSFRAEEVRTLAEMDDRVHTREQLLEVARDYDRMARSAVAVEQSKQNLGKVAHLNLKRFPEGQSQRPGGPEQFRAAMDVCVEAFNIETWTEEKLPLASAALLFAQVAELLERGSPITQAIIAHCSCAISAVHQDGVRREIEGLLSDILS